MEQIVLENLIKGLPFYGPVMGMMLFFIIMLWKRLSAVQDREATDGRENVKALTRAFDVMKELEIQLRDIPQLKTLLHQAVGVLNELFSNPDFQRRITTKKRDQEQD